MSEIEKLQLFAHDIGRPLTIDDIQSIAAAEQPRGADVAADAAILGDVKAATIAMNRFLDAGGSPISAMRTLHFRMLRVPDAAAMERPNGRALRPPVFEKEWPAFQSALRDWTPLGSSAPSASSMRLRKPANRPARLQKRSPASSYSRSQPASPDTSQAPGRALVDR